MTAGKALAGCAGTLITLPFAVMLNGYALSVLWGWFMVPVFHLPPIGIAAACGISIVGHQLTYQDTPTDKDRDWWVPLATLFIRPLLALLFGYIYRSYM